MDKTVNIGDVVNVWPTGKCYLVTDIAGGSFIGVRFGESIMLTNDLCSVVVAAREVSQRMADVFKNKPKTFFCF